VDQSWIYVQSAVEEYEMYEKACGNMYNRKCIDRTVTSCGNCVGYCRYVEHPGFLTRELRKIHNCIKKECFYYLPKPKRKAKK